ncbi:MAG: cupredoxin domain-containing protein [Dehalococcoidia bacterium]|nr:cupredoxin domain-containing protein [Dehalococcoidia bacterium]
MDRLRSLAALAAVMAFAAACADSGGGGAPGRERVQVAITLGDGGCSPERIEVDEGPIRFYVTNPRSSTVTSFEVLDGKQTITAVRNVLGGIARSQDVELQPGTFTTRCTQGSTGGTGTLIVRDLP